MQVIKLMALELSFILMIGLAYLVLVLITLGIWQIIERIKSKHDNSK